MKRSYLLSGLLFLMVTHTAIASSVELDSVQLMAKQINYAEHQQQAVWPGFHPASTASVIQFEGSRNNPIYALNFKPGSLPWRKLSFSGESIYFLPNAELLDLFGFDKQFTQVDGQKAYVDFEYFEDGAANPNFLANEFMTGRVGYYFLHESSIDPKHFNFMQTPYDNYRDINHVKLVYLEDAALTLAQQDDTGHAEEALRDAVAIRQYRNQLLSQTAREFEKGVDFLFGLPTYISWTSQQLSEADYRKMTQRTGCPPLNSLYPPEDIAICTISNFPAFSSSVYGHALEKKLAGQPWKIEVEKNFKSISQVAIEHYHFSDEQARMMAEAAIKKPEYDYDRISQIIDHNVLPYLQAMSIAENKYNTLPGIEVRTSIGLGFAFLMIGSFDEGVYANQYLINTSTLLLEDINLKSDEGELIEFNHMPFVALNITHKDILDIDLEYSYTSFKIDENAQLTLDGVTLTANDFIRNKKTQSFKTLLIVDSHLRLPLPNGILDASEGVLKLQLEETPEEMHSLKPGLFNQKLYKTNLSIQKAKHLLSKVLHSSSRH